MDYKIDVNGVVSTYHANILKRMLSVEMSCLIVYCLLKLLSQLTTTTMRNFRLKIVPFRRRRSQNLTETSVFQIH